MSQYDGFLPGWEHPNYPISICSCWVFARVAFNLPFVWPTTTLMATRTLFGPFWEWIVCRSSHCSKAVYWFASFGTRSLQGSRYSCTKEWLFILMFRGACLFERHDHSSCCQIIGPKYLEIGAEAWVEKMAITCIGGPGWSKNCEEFSCKIVFDPVRFLPSALGFCFLTGGKYLAKLLNEMLSRM
jgi:hypothetical protein